MASYIMAASGASLMAAVGSRCCAVAAARKLHRVLSVPNGMRSLTTSSARFKEKAINVTFVDYNGTKEFRVTGKENSSLLQLVRENDLDFDGYGSCDGGLSCASCHVILSQEDYDRSRPEEMQPEEQDMLDVALGVQKTSRLGCQVIITKELSGVTVRVGPEETVSVQAQGSPN